VAVHYEKITGNCTLATLNGLYGFQRNGTTTAGPLLAIGTVTYDGRGNFVASQITDRNGTFGAPTSQSGTYADRYRSGRRAGSRVAGSFEVVCSQGAFNRACRLA
jgi:hypothetical protein